MDAGDSAFFAWEIGWTIHALQTDPGSLPHGNIFHPLRYTLGMDEQAARRIRSLARLWARQSLSEPADA